MESAQSNIETIVTITEGIPVSDMTKVVAYINGKNIRLIGPNCPGIITPEEAKIGIMPGFVFKKGNVGILDRNSWLERAKSSLRLSSLEDDHDRARILCYTNRIVDNLVPHARRAIHGEMADQYQVLPGEVLSLIHI